MDEMLASLLSLGEYVDGQYTDGEQAVFLRNAQYYNRSLRKSSITRDTLILTTTAQKGTVKALLLAYLRRVDTELAKLDRYDIDDDNKRVAAPRMWVDPDESGESEFENAKKQVQSAQSTCGKKEEHKIQPSSR